MKNDFQKVLATLKATDLSFLSPTATTDQSASMVPMKYKRQRKPPRPVTPDSVVLPPSDIEVTSPETTDTSLPVAATLSPSTPDTVERPYGDHPLPVFKPPLPGDNRELSSPEPTSPQARTRHRPAHEWPPVGTQLQSDYFGTIYHAEIVPARKRLKSGKQIRLLDGPAQGKRLDSFSKAALVATARQRKSEKLGRSGMANGWTFWSWAGKNTATTQ